ncbi:hypothetical protein LZK77_31405 (plasmid) [Rhizobium leguminosarum]|nr:hypothetical protein LZK77_31405 [Rhizobium leguminosarum]
MADEDNAGAVLVGAETNMPVKAPAVKNNAPDGLKSPLSKPQRLRLLQQPRK